MSMTATSETLSKFTPPSVPAAGWAGAAAGVVAGGCAGAGGAGGCAHTTAAVTIDTIPTRSLELPIISAATPSLSPQALFWRGPAPRLPAHRYPARTFSSASDTARTDRDARTGRYRHLR